MARSWSEAPVFWDIMGPVLLLLFAVLILWWIVSFSRKKYRNMFVSGGINLLISFVFAWSIGIFLLIISLVQLIGGVFVWNRQKAQTK
ncbi:MAG: hypothetical protein H0Z33_07040 [Bacillaceae bacterium]|nr:hypothetical protein [Bacillaceae bacterium]